jgi:hypothetical protein
MTNLFCGKPIIQKRHPVTGAFSIVRAPGRARGAQAPSNQLWWLICDLEVEVLYGP